MSYKRNSKSRIARLLLALTLMGGVGQRMADRGSYAMESDPTFNVIENDGANFKASNGQWGAFKELDIDVDNLKNPVDQSGNLTDDAKLFAKLVSCGLEVEKGEINENNGEVTRQGAYNVNALKSAVFSVFNNMNNDDCFWPRYIKSFPSTGDFGNLAVVKLFLGNSSPIGFKFETSPERSLYQLFYNSDKYALRDIEKNSLLLKNFIDGLTNPESQHNSVMVIGKDGSVVVKKKENLATSELGDFDGVLLHSTANVAIDFNAVKLSEDEFASIKGTIDSFSPKEKGNFKRFNEVDFKIKVNGSDDVKGFATLMAINTYLEELAEDEENVGAAVLAASEKYRSIVTSSICKKTEEEFKKDYDVVAGISNGKFPINKKADAVNFVLLVQNFYNSVGGLKENFTIADFAEALNTEDPLMRLIQMICKAFQGQDLSKFAGGMADDTCKEFLRYELNGDGGAGGNDQPDNSDNPGGKQGKKKGKKKGLSNGKKLAMGITIPVVVAAALGIASWKTGYGQKIINKFKGLLGNKSVARPGLDITSKGTLKGNAPIKN